MQSATNREIASGRLRCKRLIAYAIFALVAAAAIELVDCKVHARDAGQSANVVEK
jgi:hypothetical protein